MSGSWAASKGCAADRAMSSSEACSPTCRRSPPERRPADDTTLLAITWAPQGSVAIA